jgi:hypothetical protein
MTYKCDTCKEIKDDCEITLFHTHYLRMCKKCRDTPNLRVKHEDRKASNKNKLPVWCGHCIYFREDFNRGTNTNPVTGICRNKKNTPFTPDSELKVFKCNSCINGEEDTEY